jgi:hypothetical protein
MGRAVGAPDTQSRSAKLALWIQTYRKIDVESIFDRKEWLHWRYPRCAAGPAGPRMRFDIVLNNLCGHAWTSGKIAMTSDGTPWRPIVHIEDICTAISCAIIAPSDAVSGEVFNVGANDENYRVREIAEIVKAVFPECELTFGASGGDNRSYRVNFDKIHSQLPGFSCNWTAEKGAQQLRGVFERIKMTAEQFSSPPYTRLKCINRLLETGQIDADYYWT